MLPFLSYGHRGCPYHYSQIGLGCPYYWSLKGLGCPYSALDIHSVLLPYLCSILPLPPFSPFIARVCQCVLDKFLSI